jgi:hypothetical protein
MKRTIQKNNITPRQQEIINQYNYLNYCKLVNNLNLADLKVYSTNDNKTNLLIANPVKLMDGEEAQKLGLRYVIKISKPLEEIKEKLLANDPEILSKVLEKIRVHNFKHHIDCGLKNVDYEKKIIDLIDEFNQISVCESFNNFKVSNLGVSRVPSKPELSMVTFIIRRWGGGSVPMINQYNVRVPFDFDETTRRIENDDEVLYRMVSIKLDKYRNELPFKCDGNVGKPVVDDNVSSVPMGGPVDNDRITHTGPKNASISYQLTPKDSINENTIRIKQIMGLN